jgi:hypothetical protein
MPHTSQGCSRGPLDSRRWRTWGVGGWNGRRRCSCRRIARWLRLGPRSVGWTRICSPVAFAPTSESVPRRIVRNRQLAQPMKQPDARRPILPVTSNKNMHFYRWPERLTGATSMLITGPDPSVAPQPGRLHLYARNESLFSLELFYNPSAETEARRSGRGTHGSNRTT